MKYFCLLFGCLITSVVCRVSNSSQRTLLHDTVLQGYNRRIHPTGPLQVAVFFSMITLKNYDVQMSQFTVSGFLTASWTDERLKWLPSDHDEISSILFYQDEIWIPGLVHWNAHASIGMVGYDDVPVRTAFSGITFWNPGEIYESSCDADVTYFPFDTQQCTMLFVAYGYTMDEVNLTVDKSLKSQDPTTLNTVWEVVDTDIFMTDANNKQILHVTVTFKRRTLIFVLSIILPVILMSVANMCVFFIPAEEGNRIDFAITMLLTISVSMTTVSEYLPKSSLPQISLLTHFVTVHVIISMLVMVFAIWSVRIYHKNNTCKMSSWIKFVTKLLLCKRSPKIRTECQIKESSAVRQPGMTEQNENGWTGQSVEDTPDHKLDDRSVTWKDVASFFDTFSLCFFTLLIGVTDAVIIGMLEINNDTF